MQVLNVQIPGKAVGVGCVGASAQLSWMLARAAIAHLHWRSGAQLPVPALFRLLLTTAPCFSPLAAAENGYVDSSSLAKLAKECAGGTCRL